MLDYIQRIAPPGEHGDRRGSVDATMNFLRQFADAGNAFLVVAAVGRTKDSKGRSSYDGDGLNLASFRESSELEFGADDAFILVPDAKSDNQVILRHLKARYTEANDLTLHFDRSCQRFEELDQISSTNGGRPKITPELASLWDKASPEADDGGGDDER